MGFLDLFTKKRSKTDHPANGDELSAAVAGILAIEAKRDKALADLERAKKALSAGYAQNIAEDAAEPSPAEVVEAQTCLEALERLLRESKGEAVGLVAKSYAAHRERRAVVEDELRAVQRAIDERLVRVLAEFCGTHGLSIQWPTQHNVGHITIPALGSFETDAEIRALAAPATVVQQPDPDSDRRKQLEDERMRLSILIGSAPDLALETVVAQARRR